MTVSYFSEQLANGLAVGSVYALIALGYSLVYSILYLINFAHGYVIMVGAFVALTLFGMEMPVIAAVFVACLAGAALGMAVERIAYRPVRSSNRIVADDQRARCGARALGRRAADLGT